MNDNNLQNAISTLKELKEYLTIHYRLETLDGISAINTVVNELECEDVPEELNGTSGKLDMKRAVDSLTEGPDSNGIPEELKGTSGRYTILMERLIERQKEMDPLWFKAHALSIVLRAYTRGMDVVYNYFEKLKKAGKENGHEV